MREIFKVWYSIEKGATAPKIAYVIDSRVCKVVAKMAKLEDALLAAQIANENEDKVVRIS